MHSSILSLAQFVLGAAHFSGGSFRNLPEIKRPLIKQWNFCAYAFSVFQYISVFCQLAIRLSGFGPPVIEDTLPDSNRQLGIAGKEV